MDKISLSQFISKTPKEQQAYLEKIIEQEQNLSQLPEKYFPKNKSNLVIVQFRRCNEVFRAYENDESPRGRAICGVFASPDSEEYVSFFTQQLSDGFYSNCFKEQQLNQSLHDEVYWCRYTIDYNNYNIYNNNRSVGIPMKLEIVSKIADYLEEYQSLFEYDDDNDDYDEDDDELYTEDEDNETIRNYENQIDELSEQNKKLNEELKEK